MFSCFLRLEALHFDSSQISIDLGVTSLPSRSFLPPPLSQPGPQSARAGGLLLSLAEPPGDLFVVFQVISSDIKQNGGLAVAGTASLEMPLLPDLLVFAVSLWLWFSNLPSACDNVEIRASPVQFLEISPHPCTGTAANLAAGVTVGWWSAAVTLPMSSPPAGATTAPQCCPLGNGVGRGRP